MRERVEKYLTKKFKPLMVEDSYLGGYTITFNKHPITWMINMFGFSNATSKRYFIIWATNNGIVQIKILLTRYTWYAGNIFYVCTHNRNSGDFQHDLIQYDSRPTPIIFVDNDILNEQKFINVKT